MESRQKIKTRFLILSDTHGDEYPQEAALKAQGPFDVVIHCGDLTEESKLAEFQSALSLLKELDAPLKLVIGGNHDFTLDDTAFLNMLGEAGPLDADLVEREFGQIGQARRLFDAPDANIVLLGEETREFSLDNGARLKVFASPYTPSKHGNWGFSYTPEQDHDWDIEEGTDVVITHGPPHGILDRTDAKERAGSPSLFAAVARARPRLHCFGHIHEGWGARLVAWRDKLDPIPTHFNAVDNDASRLVESLRGIKPGKYDSQEDVHEKAQKRRLYQDQGAVTVDHHRQSVTSPEDVSSHRAKTETLFVNSSIQGPSPEESQTAWIVDLDLSMSSL